MADNAPHPWWRGAVIYQIYPRSFADANGDGLGDLPGITAHLDHVAALGADAVWVSPFFASPQADFGYDVSDYRDVDPAYGTLADADRMIARAHELGLRVVVDMVWAHTSDRHPWFAASRAGRDGDHADWYVWADPKPDGTPPNNWQSVFGGPAWTWDARRRQYYMHSFLSAQPQLNVHLPAVQDALLDVARFWLDRGADGFRLDAINHSMPDPLLRDNPPALPDGRPRTRPFDYQDRLHSQGHTDVPRFLERVCALTDRYPDAFTVAEVGGARALAEMREYTAPGRLDTAYGFDFLYADRLTPAAVRRAVRDWPGAAGEGWPSWAFENHDAPRAVSRWAAPEHRDAFARAKALLLLCLRGNAFLYQGEELGLTQVDVPFERLVDPEAIANWPLTLSRDGARTPMPWVGDAPDLGFGSRDPWLPIGPDHAALAVDRQEADAHSLLHFTRAAIALRRAHPALRTGDLTLIGEDEQVIAFERREGEERLLVAINLSSERVDWVRPGGWTPFFDTGEVGHGYLGPYAGFVAARA